MNNYFIIGKVNEGKSYLFNLFSKTHKTISNPKANTTIDVIRKNILSENFEYNIYDTPGFYKFSDFTNLLNKISELSLDNVNFIYLTSSFTNEDLKICKQLHSNKFNLLLFSFKKINEKDYISNLFTKIFTSYSDNLTTLKKYLSNENKKQNSNSDAVNKKTIAIFGKENTGKSTLFNKIMSISLSKTSPHLHTTRDSVNWDIKYKNQTLEFIDTAGFIRSRSNRKNFDFEKLSLEQSEYFIKKSSLLVLLLDANSESRLDLSLIGSLSKRNKPFLVLVNKIDLIENNPLYQQKFLKYLSSNHNYYSSLNIYFISALNTSKSKILQIVNNRIDLNMISYQYDYNYIQQNYKVLMNIIYFINLLIPLFNKEFRFVLSFEKDNHYKVHLNNFKMSLLNYLNSLKIDLVQSNNINIKKLD